VFAVSFPSDRGVDGEADGVFGCFLFPSNRGVAAKLTGCSAVFLISSQTSAPATLTHPLTPSQEGVFIPL